MDGVHIDFMGGLLHSSVRDNTWKTDIVVEIDGNDRVGRVQNKNKKHDVIVIEDDDIMDGNMNNNVTDNNYEDDDAEIIMEIVHHEKQNQ